MYRLFLVAVLSWMTAGICHGQITGELNYKLPTEYQVGDKGYVPYPFKTFGKVSDREYLVTIYTTDQRRREIVQRIVLLRGLDFSGVTDGSVYRENRTCIATGTYTYKSVDGLQTVLVLDFFEGKKLDEKHQELLDKLAEEKRKMWERQLLEDDAKLKVVQEERRKVEKDRMEKRASMFLDYARKLIDSGNNAKAKTRIQEIIKEFPDTESAGVAKALLEKLGK